MNHIDLFSGIGGFALAAQQVWENYETTLFCDNDRFCQQVLRKRFPNVPIYGDIRELTKERFIADTDSGRLEGTKKVGWNGLDVKRSHSIDLLTGGFPCQPFSQAGKRKGTDDNRYLWPEMLRVISDFKPTWVIAENVRGILTIEGGMVFEQVCLDLEREGYEVQPIIIPACAVNAPHRRDRVWFVAHRNDTGERTSTSDINRERSSSIEKWEQPQLESCGQVIDDTNSNEYRGRGEQIREKEGLQGVDRTALCSGRTSGTGEYVTNSEGGQPRKPSEQKGREDISRGNREIDTNPQSTGLSGGTNGQGKVQFRGSCSRIPWLKSWGGVATTTCDVRMDDGLPVSMDGLELSKSRHRVERLKSLGNSIVPQVAVEIMKAIKFSEVI